MSAGRQALRRPGSSWLPGKRSISPIAAGARCRVIGQRQLRGSQARRRREVVHRPTRRRTVSGPFVREPVGGALQHAASLRVRRGPRFARVVDLLAHLVVDLCDGLGQLVGVMAVRDSLCVPAHDLPRVHDQGVGSDDRPACRSGAPTGPRSSLSCRPESGTAARSPSACRSSRRPPRRSAGSAAAGERARLARRSAVAPVTRPASRLRSSLYACSSRTDSRITFPERSRAQGTPPPRRARVRRHVSLVRTSIRGAGPVVARRSFVPRRTLAVSWPSSSAPGVSPGQQRVRSRGSLLNPAVRAPPVASPG